MEAEAEIQRVKARQAFLDNLAVMVAMTSIVILAVVIVILKSVMFPDEKIITFIPLTQQVKVWQTALQYALFSMPMQTNNAQMWTNSTLMQTNNARMQSNKAMMQIANAVFFDKLNFRTFETNISDQNLSYIFLKA